MQEIFQGGSAKEEGRGLAGIIATTVLIAGIAAGRTVAAQAQSETLDLPAFTAIEAEDGVELIIEVGPEQAVTVSGADRDHYNLRVRDGRLEIDAESDRWVDSGNGRVDATVRVTMPDLAAISIAKGSYARVSGVSGEALKAGLSQGAVLVLKSAELAQLSVDVSTGSLARLSGRCERLVIQVSEGASSEAGDLVCADVSARAATGANLEVHATGTLSATATLGANISVRGDPERRDISESLGGNVSL